MSNAPMTYAAVGVNYELLDFYKRQAQDAARTTDGNLPLGFKVVSWTRGESCFLLETPWGVYLAHVEEGLGTKNLVADLYYKQVVAAEMEKITGKPYYAHIAQDAVAMIVNDMITLGALPLVVAQHLAVGNDFWFRDYARAAAFVDGWRQACNLAQCVWGPGETPTLKNIIVPGTALISGSSVGWVTKERLINPSIQDGDAIILLESSGIHANGLTMARKIAESLPAAYLTPLSDGQTYGQALLAPTHIYVPTIKNCLDEQVPIHYAVNITGHGWRKLMRAKEPFVYVIDKPGIPQPLFAFMQLQGPISNHEAYANFNMGAGFALYVPEEDVEKVCTIASKNSLRAWRAGHIEKRGNGKKVIIEPKGIVFDESSLVVR